MRRTRSYPIPRDGRSGRVSAQDGGASLEGIRTELLHPQGGFPPDVIVLRQWTDHHNVPSSLRNMITVTVIIPIVLLCTISKS